jgi:hypothetical protein
MTKKQIAIVKHAEAVKRYEKAENGYKRGHEKAVKDAMTNMLRIGA